MPAPRRLVPPLDPLVIAAADDGWTAVDAAEMNAGVEAARRVLDACGSDHVAWRALEPRWSIWLAWAALTSGRRFSPLNTHLTPAEVAAAVAACGATALLVEDDDTAAMLRQVVAVQVIVLPDRPVPDGEWVAPSWGPAVPITGVEHMLTSGSTGPPRPAAAERRRSLIPLTAELLAVDYGVGSDSVHLAVGPLYHAAPLLTTLGAQRAGARVVVMPRFDPLALLETVDALRVTHLQVVPTMLVRLMKLPESVRGRFDMTSLEAVVHAASPCPRDVKQSVFDWLGPIVHEYYAGTEGYGATSISPHEWLAHPGSVGLAGPDTVITGRDGTAVAPGETGQVCFRQPDGRLESYGDVGHVDEDGYLYLVERQAHVIVRGGVNVYPREIEEALLAYPDVQDAYVTAGPDDDLGSVPIAFVCLPESDCGTVAEPLRAHLAERLAPYKRPVALYLVASLDRDESGKLLRSRGGELQAQAAAGELPVL